MQQFRLSSVFHYNMVFPGKSPGVSATFTCNSLLIWVKKLKKRQSLGMTAENAETGDSVPVDRRRPMYPFRHLH